MKFFQLSNQICAKMFYMKLDMKIYIFLLSWWEKNVSMKFKKNCLLWYISESHYFEIKIRFVYFDNSIKIYKKNNNQKLNIYEKFKNFVEKKSE